MSVIAHEVKSRFRLPMGLNVLRNDGIGSVAVAAATGAEFIRINVYTGARITDQGIVQGQAHRILRMRKILNAQCRILADVAVKHSSPLGPRSLEDEVSDTVHRGGADAIIVSGSATGKPASIEDLRTTKAAAGATSVFLGSGAGEPGLEETLRYADGIIVGTAIKRDGIVTNPVDPERVKSFMTRVKAIREREAPTST
jgi:membrane complex biogenesis BtpA family protein